MYDADEEQSDAKDSSPVTAWSVPVFGLFHLHATSVADRLLWANIVSAAM